MIYIARTSGKYHSAFVDESPEGGKSRLKTVSLEVMSERKE